MLEISRIVEDGGSGQDRAGVFVRDDATIIAIADGAGGMSGGSVAADRIIQEVERLLDSGADPGATTTWERCIGDIDTTLGETGQTTALIIVITDALILGASVGDSEAKLFTARGVVDLSGSQHRKPLVGSGKAKPVTFREPSEAGVLLAATDGLWKYAKPPLLAEAVQADEVEQVTFLAVESARLPSGHLQDDVAVVAVRL